MSFESINPVDGSTLKTFAAWDDDRIEQALDSARRARFPWADTAVARRAELLHAAARVLRERQQDLARTITAEMGKLLQESLAEVEKCAWVCEFYAEQGADFLADELIETDAGRSLVAYQPLGAVLAVMPWNFPFWQVFRFAAPALMAGNVGLLKHASNVPQCALAIEEIFHQAGFPQGVFQSLLIASSQVESVIEDERVQAVTLTGSEAAGRAVAAAAGRWVKKTVLELGGSDAFVVLEDADLDLAVQQAVASRFQNCGQSCIAAKRFIPVAAVADSFVERFRAAIAELQTGDPLQQDTRLGPMARRDLRDELHEQVRDCIDAGGEAVLGCAPEDGPGAFYKPSLLDRVTPAARAYREEVFGPVATVIRARDEDDAVRIANDTPYGLGGSVWTRDGKRGEAVARRLQCGAAFVNGLVKSDPRLPFGGIKNSGYGRELSRHGIREFVNAKTIWIR